MSYRLAYTGPKIDELLGKVDAGVVPVVGKGINLLDNWYFVGGGSQQSGGQFPINQRGQTIWYGSEDYTIDRWSIGRYRTGTKSVTLQSDGMVLANSDTAESAYIEIRQLIPVDFSDGTEITMSVIANGELRTFTDTVVHGYYKNATWGNFMLYFRQKNDGKLECIIRLVYGSSVTIKAVKLELGNTQTLARQVNGAWVLNDPPPNYQQEMEKCQRYFQIFRTQSLRPTYGVDFRPVMATASPTLSTLTIDGITYYTASSDL